MSSKQQKLMRDLRTCQLRKDNSESPEYWDWEGDYIEEEDEMEREVGEKK